MIHETLRQFDFLGGQQAPRASDGVGKRVLYRCGECQRIWFQDGARITLELAHEQVQALARELDATLAHLPLSTCRLCLYRTGGGVTEIDEYGKGKGFGWSWEYLFPHPLHALLTITSTRWLRSIRDMSLLTLPDVVTCPQTMRAVLAWFVELEPPQQIQPLDSLMRSMLRRTNPPGFDQPETENWRWSGWQGQISCAPLQGQAALMLALALPPLQEEPAFAEVFSVWQSLAFLTLLGNVTGEQRSVSHS